MKKRYLFFAAILAAMSCAMSVKAQTDVTSTYFSNTNFSTGNATGWTNKYYGTNTPGISSNTFEYYSSATTNNSSCFALSQKQITDLPEGVYRLTVNGYTRTPNNYTNVIFFGETTNKQYQVNLKTLASETAAYGSTPGTMATASTAFYSSAQTGGYWLNTIDNIIVEDGKLNIGITNIGQIQCSTGVTSWTIFGNFKLYQLTGAALQPLLNSKISQAQTLATLNYSNVATLNSAISAAQAITAANITYNDIKTLQNAINVYNAGSLNDASDVTPVDASFLIKNASFENGANHMLLNQITGQTGTDFALSGGGGYFSPIGWTTTIASAVIGTGSTWDGAVVGDNGIIPIAGTTMTPTNGSYFFGSRKRWNSGIITLNQVLSSLPSGTYKLSVDLGTSSTTTYTGTFTAKVNGTSVFTATPTTTAFTTFTSTNFTVGSGQTLDLTVAMGNNSANTDFRIVMDNIKLTYYGTTDPTISALQSSAPLTIVNNSATLNLTAKNLTQDITITVPSTNITLSGANVTGTSPNYTIAVANANTTNNITATWDKGANVSGNINFTSGTASKNIAVTTDDIESVSITGITLGAGGVLSPAYTSGTTEYTIKAPADINSVSVTATTSPTTANVTNNGLAVSASTPSRVLTGNSYLGTNHTAAYTFTWNGNYTFNDWAAGGTNTDAVLSVPTIYGWSANPTLTWVAANSTNAGTVRYMDMDALGKNAGISGITYTYNTNNYNGRIMFVRWDGNAGRIYSYPVALETGITYQFTGKAAWNSVDVAPTLTFAINSAKDNLAATGVASNTVVTGAAGLLSDIAINSFTVPATGIYYLNITSSTPSLCAIADLAIVGTPTSLDSKTSNMFVSANSSQLTVHGTQAGNVVSVYNMSGVLISKFTATSNTSTLNLKQGAYFVKVNDNVMKAIIK